jgi:hypothetical protein
MTLGIMVVVRMVRMRGMWGMRGIVMPSAVKAQRTRGWVLRRAAMVLMTQVMMLSSPAQIMTASFLYCL